MNQNKTAIRDANVTALAYYYEKQNETIRECLYALRNIILNLDENIVHKRRFQIPNFCYKEYNLGYLWVVGKKVHVGFIEDKKIQPAGAIKDSYTSIKVNPNDDIPIVEIIAAYVALINKYKQQ